jgi:hypothetical protein
MSSAPSSADLAAAARAAEIAFPDAPPGKRDPSIGLRRSGFRVGYLAALATFEPSVEEHARDAARYRWLRAQHWSEGVRALVVTKPAALRLGALTFSREQLDAEIDTAMVQGGQSGDGFPTGPAIGKPMGPLTDCDMDEDESS